MAEPVLITGADLDPATLEAIARDGAPVAIDAAARSRMATTAALVERAAAAGRPIYGVTTGLGARVTDPVDPGETAGYPLRTIRGRATGVGDPLPRELVRAAIAVRLNGLCAGGAGARPTLAEGLAALLNAGIHPAIPRSGSLGPADLCLMAHVGLALIGEGRAELDGVWMDAGDALGRCGLGPVPLGPRDGLAVCSSSAVAIGAAALALRDARACLDAAQISAALAMEGFRASLAPIDPRVVDARPAPGQAWAAAGLRALLAGGELEAAERPRRLQDPLSVRCASQLHGALHAALDFLEAAVMPELSGAADNPLVLAGPSRDGEGDGEILATGNFASPALALALDGAAIACAQVAHAIAERQARLKEPRLSGLPANLVAVDPSRAASRSGVAPLSKTAAALALEIRHLAAPVATLQAVVSDGVEDDSTGALQGALRLREQLAKLRLLVALEMLVAAQAVDVASAVGGSAANGSTAPGGSGATGGLGRPGGPGNGTPPIGLGAGTRVAHRAVRELVPPLREDRALGPEVERLERALVAGGALAGRVRDALGTAAPR
ncbi:MAG TPA: aromatic amino acid lyase [Solirubrobacteraceae bacterium]|nr:aromatic amino acid lyase [Solirubrobacteraceae bacterium]